MIFSNKHLIITGGTGFFGRALLRFLLKNASYTISVLSRNPAKFLESYPEFNVIKESFICGDILVPESLPRDQNFSHLLHAATDSTIGNTLTPSARYEQIVSGTKNILDLAVNVGVERFLFVSSGGVYGPQPSDMASIPESYCGMPDPLNPSNSYGVAKRAAEHLCALYHDSYGIETVVARCFTFVGRDLPLHVHFAIGNFIRDALWKDEIIVSGDGTTIRSYLDQSDLAIWLMTVLEIGYPRRAYNVGSDKPISILDLAYLVRDVICPNKNVRIVGDRLASDVSRSRYVPDIMRARNELGLSVSVALKDAIRDAALAHR
jgi:UDP-glucuronate decarboxylase